MLAPLKFTQVDLRYWLKLGILRYIDVMDAKKRKGLIHKSIKLCDHTQP